MKKLLILLTLTFVFLSIIQNSYAHVGGGPPFLLVNGQYALTNPYFIGSSAFNIPQDYPFTHYLVNTPIHFEVDTSKLLVPPDIAAESTFRWAFGDGTSYKYARKIDYTYAKQKSYLVTLDVKSPDQSDYINIDTVQIDVVPSLTYKLPSVVLSLDTEKMQSNKPIRFKAVGQVDPSAKIQKIMWDFGDDATANTAFALHSYQNFTNYTTYFVICRIVDTNGYYIDTGFIVESIKGTLEFVDKNGRKNTIPIGKTPNRTIEAVNSSHVIVYIVSGIILSVILIVVFVVKKNKK